MSSYKKVSIPKSGKVKMWNGAPFWRERDNWLQYVIAKESGLMWFVWSLIVWTIHLVWKWESRRMLHMPLIYKKFQHPPSNLLPPFSNLSFLWIVDTSMWIRRNDGLCYFSIFIKEAICRIHHSKSSYRRFFLLEFRKNLLSRAEGLRSRKWPDHFCGLWVIAHQMLFAVSICG